MPDPTVLVIDHEPRCRRCHNSLTSRGGYVTRPWRLRCERCRVWNEMGTLEAAKSARVEA